MGSSTLYFYYLATRKLCKGAHSACLEVKFVEGLVKDEVGGYLANHKSLIGQGEKLEGQLSVFAFFEGFLLIEDTEREAVRLLSDKCHQMSKAHKKLFYLSFDLELFWMIPLKGAFLTAEAQHSAFFAAIKTVVFS